MPWVPQTHARKLNHPSFMTVRCHHVFGKLAQPLITSTHAHAHSHAYTRLHSLMTVHVEHMFGKLLGAVFPRVRATLFDHRKSPQNDENQQMEEDRVEKGESASQRRSQDEADRRQRSFLVRTHRTVLPVTLLAKKGRGKEGCEERERDIKT